MKNRHGFTLFDLLIAIAIACILLGVGLPGLTHLFNKLSADTNAHAIWRGLAKARETAVISAATITFCGVDNAGRCVRDNITTFAIFDDRNGNRSLDSDEQPIQRIDVNFKGTTTLRASSHPFITFSHYGSAKQYGSIVLCHHSKNPLYIRRISVNAAGRTYLARDLNGDGIVAAADRSPINCD